jgi:hypothetical protein
VLARARAGLLLGMGGMTCEEVVHDPATGERVSKGSFDYHIPTALDLPHQLNVTLLPHAPNPKGVLSSKATAEPPVMLSSSVFLALRQCVAAARADQGHTEWFDLHAPATTERLQALCMVDAKTSGPLLERTLRMSDVTVGVGAKEMDGAGAGADSRARLKTAMGLDSKEEEARLKSGGADAKLHV